MKKFEEVFNPFDHDHIEEFVRAITTGDAPDFGVAALGWLPANWQVIAVQIILRAFHAVLENQQTQPDEPTGNVDIQRLIWQDIGTYLTGQQQKPVSAIQGVYQDMLGSVIRLKQFLVEAEAAFGGHGRLQ